MIFEILDVGGGQKVLGRYVFDDIGPTTIEIQINPFVAVRWAKSEPGDLNRNDMPVIPPQITERWKAAQAKATGGVVMLKAGEQGVEEVAGPKLIVSNN